MRNERTTPWGAILSPAIIAAWLLLAATVALHFTTNDILALHYFSLALAIAAVGLCGARLSALQAAALGATISAALLADNIWFGGAPHEIGIELASLIALPLILWAARSATIEVKSRPDAYYWDEAAETSMGRYLAEIESAFLVRTLASIDAVGTAVDAGAGHGRFSRILASSARRVVAIEANASLTSGLSAVAGNVTPLLVDPAASQLPLRDGSADFIVCIETPDLAQHEWFWRECARVLSTRGRLILTLQNRRSWKGLLARRNRQRYRARYGAEYYAMSLGEIATGLANAGLAIESAEGFNWLPMPRASDSALVAPLLRLEWLLGLRSAASLSPWIILSARLVSPSPRPPRGWPGSRTGRCDRARGS
ncbi:MAG: class I SAM-dependent methyltransferase [Dehalococcoidia bacterium]